jgi:hypothetical protein
VADYKISIYTNILRNSRKPTFRFTVHSEEQVLSHVKQLWRDGYKRMITVNKLEWFPPHIIQRIEVEGPGLSSGYNDEDLTT